MKTKIVSSLIISKTIYNRLLNLSILAYQVGKVSLNKFDYNKIIQGEYPQLHSQSAQNISDRVYKAFQNFFRRVKDKKCKKKGFPRFKSRVNSITYPQSGFKLLSSTKLRLSKIGTVPIILHRAPKGVIKTLTIKCNDIGQWFAIFCCEILDNNPINPSVKKVGIDLGIENFLMRSDGISVNNPKFLSKSEKRLKRLQRRLSRTKKGSHNRRKSRYRFAKQNLKVSNQRMDFCHKESFKLVQEFGTIHIEDLNIKKMLLNSPKGRNRNINDASWNLFVRNLEYKAVKCGSKLIKINPAYTSQTCSKCGTRKEMPLNERNFLCPSCGLSLHRDLNASINILTVGTDCPELNACGDSTSLTEQSVESRIIESGTIMANTSTASVVGSPVLNSRKS
jgi:putative transposase